MTTNFKDRRAWRAVETTVERHWADFAIDLTAKGHIRVRLRRAGQSRTIIRAGTGSDQRGLLNFEADVKRAVRELKGLPA